MELNNLMELPPYEFGPTIEEKEAVLLGPPNDPYWSTVPLTGFGQWNLRNINALSGWDIQKGDRRIVVAVLDTGIRYTHIELINSYLPLGSIEQGGRSDELCCD